ncbi:MAG: helix-turn-helix domain-containing protein [Verrucomicrobia bacterium]|nr:helix-turn-helix domain-containing protein [Verrucomicrobiota bacterium]
MNTTIDSPALSSVAQAPRLAYRVRETAQMLGVSDKTVRRLVARGLLRPSRALRHLLIPHFEVERFLKETL